ncbi:MULTISPECIES: M23 family metallopeptidase [unclassified Streptomyces]|uniref:M23 family metallopeptidase n=1 Tax=unclassified Streptomyces TaxID=2593676 RepID=UPI00136A6AD1|nr:MULTISPECIES: M23 family metallopeptidase [unclassified Streptomyces]NEA00007.1 M23 family metallopeptidase [Streptomyces sp. SID10116]MYY85652.1 peptidoglycan DD-metalloendopeptidase family protein [Streptomyces sp. SID335]MYZ15947.1 peptidoglycan DD-metalloendopeptidase family protein [Streptomyces sp. SID337]NDZ86051.1 M23 family metallopeptidase [Streptomyces sp. SID10115]NEB45343.1 M23 family metallopeptidase [Streptomyces sp. SID339]
MSVGQRKAAALLQRLLLLFIAAHLIVVFTGDPPYPSWLGLAAAVGVFGLSFALGADARREAKASQPSTVEIEPPVTGRWSALNSPADKVPSHGTRSCGQAYAIDIVAEPADGPGRPAFAWLWPLARGNRAFPAFGAPLLAVADATVVHAEDGQRDHLSRNSLAGILYLIVVEGFGRSLGGARRIVGNHVILDIGEGTYAVYAHVKQGSLTVRAGDRVTVGQELGRCGNSGNSTEPHVHFQLMDGPDLDTARGVPFSWRGVGVPRNHEMFTVREETTPVP